jgi:CO/xanthine dehydrogenase Mo-binding subunit
VSDPEAALASDAPRIHGEANTFVHHKVRKGDMEKGLAQADFIIERKFRTPCIEHSYPEPEAVLAEPAEHGGVSHYRQYSEPVFDPAVRGGGAEAGS